MKFLLISSGRSGTHMLRSIFMSHPDLYGWWDYKGSIAHLPGRLPSELRPVYKGLPPNSIFGTMVHFNESVVDPLDAAWTTHWSRLLGMQDSIIVLTRQNHLRQYLSMRLAQRDWKVSDYHLWGSTRPREVQPKPIELDLIDFTVYRTRLLTVQRFVRNLLPFTAYYVLYEELTENWERTIHGLYTYLGLHWNDPKPGTYKQETRPLDQIIANWEEVAPELQDYI